MAAEDREKSFEQALARHLRSAPRDGAAEPLRPGANAPTGTCLDLEMLAAYHERSLLSEEMNSAKEHIVRCGRCQSILAGLEVSDSIALEPVATEKKILAAAPQKPRAPIPIRGARWAWLVPAGAVAAGLIAWIGVHEGQRQKALAPSNEIKMAKAEKVPPSPPAALPPLSRSPASLPAEQGAAASENSRGGAPADYDMIARETDSLKLQQKVSPRAKIAAPAAGRAAGAAGADKELRKDANALRDSSADLAKRAENQPVLDAKAAETALQLAEQVQVQSQAVQSQVGGMAVQNQLPPPKAAAPAALDRAEAKKQKSDDSSPAGYRPAPSPAPQQQQQPPPPPPAAFIGRTSLEISAVTNPHLITAPDTSFVWRAGRAGLLEFSKDNGTTWSRQTSGVLTDLTTGAAPSASVCWIVGRAGTILLTTDGGGHWAILHSPLGEDLGGVRATDAQHATIWNARNTKTFETADGGVTWKAVPAP